jgi:hypothetical protein
MSADLEIGGTRARTIPLPMLNQYAMKGHRNKRETDMELVEKINAALDAGKKITIATHLRVYCIAAKDRAAWRKAGHEYFKSDQSGAALMIDGQRQGKPRYSCINYAKISAA